MSPNNSSEMMPGRSEFLDTAASWLARCGAGLSAAEAAEFARWRDADPRHAWAFEQVQATQHLLMRLPESPAAAAMMAEVDALMKPRRTRVLRFPWIAAAGLAAAACIAVMLWVAAPARDADHTTYSTATGARQSVALSDGSTLVLNGDSEVEVAFAAAERRVQLNRGETHFFVAKDPARPFLVSAGEVTIRAVGTAFNVRREAAAVEVLVTEGKVQVSRDSSSAAALSSPESVFLISGQRVLIDTLVAGIPALAATADESAPAGQSLTRSAPRLFFSNTPLSEVVARFNRYNELQIEIAEPELGRLAVGGNFDADNAESIIALLSTAGDVRVERVSPTRIRLHKAR